MLVLKYQDGEVIGKMFKNQMGYHYKIYMKLGGKLTVVGQSFVNLFDKGLCMERMITDMKLLNEIE